MRTQERKFRLISGFWATLVLKDKGAAQQGVVRRIVRPMRKRSFCTKTILLYKTSHFAKWIYSTKTSLSYKVALFEQLAFFNKKLPLYNQKTLLCKNTNLLYREELLLQKTAPLYKNWPLIQTTTLFVQQRPVCTTTSFCTKTSFLYKSGPFVQQRPFCTKTILFCSKEHFQRPLQSCNFCCCLFDLISMISGSVLWRKTSNGGSSGGRLDKGNRVWQTPPPTSTQASFDYYVQLQKIPGSLLMLDVLNVLNVENTCLIHAWRVWLTCLTISSWSFGHLLQRVGWSVVLVAAFAATWGQIGIIRTSKLAPFGRPNWHHSDVRIGTIRTSELAPFGRANWHHSDVRIGTKLAQVHCLTSRGILLNGGPRAFLSI